MSDLPETPETEKGTETEEEAGPPPANPGLVVSPNQASTGRRPGDEATVTVTPQ